MLVRTGDRDELARYLDSTRLSRRKGRDRCCHQQAGEQQGTTHDLYLH
ncbi:MAG: hypothetical protein ABF665_07510 [Gluconacetobacter sp.]